MRILFTTQPGVGHFHPLVPLARALEAAGHEVAVACAASFCFEVERAGLRAFPAGRDWLTPDLVQAFPVLRDIAPGPDRYAWARVNIFAGATAHEAVPDLLALARTWPPDLIVREAAEYGGCLAAELLGIPHAVVRTDTGSAAYGERMLVAQSLAEARERLGLPPDPEVAMPFRYLRLSFAGALDDPADSAAPTAHQLRPTSPLPAEEGSGGLATYPQSTPGRPFIYATLGTMYNSQVAIFDAILEALGEEVVDLLLTVGQNQDPAQFGPRPSHIRIERFVAQALVLPRCDLVVTHGGFGTVSAALAHGLPLVIIPISADQPENARRCAALGVARVIPPGERTPEVIRAAVRDVLADPSYRANAHRVRDETAALPGMAHAVGLLERLAREHRPLYTAS